MSVTVTAPQVARMREAVKKKALFMRATVERSTAAGDEYDEHGDPIGGSSWAVLHANLPCYWWSERATEVLGPTAMYTVTRQQMTIPAGTDIRTSDRIAEVRGVDGAVMAGPLAVTGVHPRQFDILLDVEEVKGSA